MLCSFVLAEKVCLLAKCGSFLLSDTCSKYVQIYVFPVKLSKRADSPFEATSEKIKVKSHSAKTSGAHESWSIASEKSAEGLS